MSIQNSKGNKEKFISIRTDEQFRDLYKEKALELNYRKSSEYFRYIVENYNDLEECYKMLNSLFVDLSNKADTVISNFGVLRDMITDNLDIEKLKRMNRILELE